MTPVHGEHHGSAGKGRRNEQGRTERDPEPPPSSQSTEERPILRKEGRMHPTTTSSRSETQPPSRPPPLTIYPPVHLEPSTDPSLCPSIHLGPPPAPGRQAFTASSVTAASWGLGQNSGQSRLVLGQPELLESQIQRGTLSRDRKRLSHVVPLRSITGSIRVINEGFRPRTRLVSVTPCSVDVSVGPGSTAQGCWKGCLQRSFKQDPPGILLRVDVPGSEGQGQQGSVWMPVTLSWGQFHPDPRCSLHLPSG